MQQIEPSPVPDVMEKLRSGFEDTDFISVPNAGLVLFWPFLPRFFENLELLTDKAFQDETARNKAVCALQYLIDEDEAGLFEGVLTLNKVLCGIPQEDTVELHLLSVDEKEIADSLLESVIARGPLWKSLSIAGFRTAYLQREGQLTTRDDHWLLRVEKATHDITMEKLPWSFTVVKLPWMPEPLMVEWM